MAKLRNLLIVVLFLAMVYAPVAVDGWLRARGVKLPGRALFKAVEKIDKQDFVDGNAGRKLEEDALNKSHTARWIIAHHNELAYRAFGRVGPSAWLGKDGWIFIPDRTKEIPARRRQEVLERDVRAIRYVRDRLLAHGARLFVALVPNCSRVYADKAYRDGRIPPQIGRFLPDLTAALSAEGIDVVNLTDALVEQRQRGPAPFYADDHHWTSHAAKTAARAIHAALPPELRALVPAQEAQPRFQEIWTEQAESESSLLRRLGFVPDGALERRFRRREPRVQFEGPAPRAFAESCGTYWSTSYGLFGSPQFFNNEARCPVRIVMKAGTGSGYAPQSDLERLKSTPNLGGRHLVVWEIPEYHLIEDASFEAFSRVASPGSTPGRPDARSENE